MLSMLAFLAAAALIAIAAAAPVAIDCYASLLRIAAVAADAGLRRRYPPV